MNYQDEFRDRKLVASLASRICRMAESLPHSVSFMEVCGTHTMSIYRYGIRSLLPHCVSLVSGPGCPVCVTPVSYIDKAIACASTASCMVATFGDMMRIPGSGSSLMQERAKGADVRIVYSPLDAVSLAAFNPEKMVVFLGIGFETTAPAVAASILYAADKGISNFCVLASHKTMPVPMQILSSDPGLALSGYLCPAHVSTVTGTGIYESLADRYRIPCVVTGFEPADVMQGIEMLLRQTLAGKSIVEIQYRRAVTREGNKKAQDVLRQVFEPCDAVWRGLGMLPGSGLKIRPELSRYDAETLLDLDLPEAAENPACRCGEILKGKLTPFECPLFASACTPESPAGACMVSGEGTCAAAFKYAQRP